MLDLITVGNIVADLYLSAENFTTKQGRLFLSEGKYVTNKFYFKVGGGGANVAIGAKKNGLRATVCGIIGNNTFRRQILHTLKLKGISTDLALFKQNYTALSVILLKADGERTIINHETPHEHLGTGKNFVKRLKKTRSVYFGNIPDVPLEERKQVMKELKKRKVLIFANLGTSDCARPKKTMSDFITPIDILILNGYEFADLIKRPYEKIDYRENVVRYFPALKDKILIVTDSKKGSYGYAEGEVYYQKAIEPRKIIDTTGAGDAYSAGFIAGYLKHEDIQIAMKKGAQYASHILGKVGAN